MEISQRIKNLISIAEQEAKEHENPKEPDDYYWQGYYVGQLWALREILAEVEYGGAPRASKQEEA